MITLCANSQIKFGVKAGVNVSGLSDVSVSGGGISVNVFESAGMATGFHAGAFVNFGFGNLFGFQPELLFSMQGGKQKVNSTLTGGQSATVDFTFDYLNVPILLEIKPIPNLGILVGPQVGLNVYKSAASEGETVSGSDFDEAFGDEAFQSIDFAVAFGVQYTLIEHLTIGARYNLGLTNAYSDSETENGVTANASGWKNNSLQVSVGWRF
jgi:hypothetical protein